MNDDLIKRSAAIRALNREKSDWNCDYNVPIDNCIKRLNKVKSADRPQGEWIDCKGGWKCSNCRKWNDNYSKFCPNCGARMHPKLQGKHFDSIIIDEPWKGSDDED